MLDARSWDTASSGSTPALTLLGACNVRADRFEYPRNATSGPNAVQRTTSPALHYRDQSSFAPRLSSGRKSHFPEHHWQQASARCSNADEAVFSFGIIYGSSAGGAFDRGVVMSRNQPVLVAPILGLSIPVPTYLRLGFTQPEASGRINRYCEPKQQSQTATGSTALLGTADQSPAGTRACQSDPYRQGDLCLAGHFPVPPRIATAPSREFSGGKTTRLAQDCPFHHKMAEANNCSHHHLQGRRP
jgi:hypothetical protein